MVKMKNSKHRKVMKERLDKMFGGELSDLIMKYKVVHHKDKNKKNNALSNLKLMEHEEHTSYHHAGRRKNK